MDLTDTNVCVCVCVCVCVWRGGGLLQNESAREKPIKPARGSARHSHFTEACGHVQNASWSADPERN